MVVISSTITCTSYLSFFCMRRPHPASTLFPYTTLFRSDVVAAREHVHTRREQLPSHVRRDAEPTRSEEHTSELQSRQYLVCRLLLEKKKENACTATTLLREVSSYTIGRQ